eukprot:gnl/TRDRNA2_/TRDRNA2_167806_c0_seq1.p1 gnl/TRDRNA2_/TRDRNA2_167806_c0~~gnl/TRDRNA2_/TRDRNA2_167806_c0_seq1.p1  ORF type:complete len:374 (+),score=45.45 gnl/TRDRNA2_/TRDRNA2_167806_c0_seq1:40-1161(+)
MRRAGQKGDRETPDEQCAPEELNATHSKNTAQLMSLGPPEEKPGTVSPKGMGRSALGAAKTLCVGFVSLFLMVCFGTAVRFLIYSPPASLRGISTRGLWGSTCPHRVTSERHYRQEFRYAGHIYLTGHLRSYRDTLANFKAAVLSQFPERVKVCVHTSPSFDHNDATWWRFGRGSGRVELEGDAVKRAVLESYHPQVSLVPDPEEFDLRLRAPQYVGKVWNRVDSQIYFSQYAALREVHRACASGGSPSPLVVKSRPDILIDADGLSVVLDEIYEWLLNFDTRGTRLIFAGCIRGQRDGPDMVDVTFVTTLEVLDLMLDWDIMASAGALERDRIEPTPEGLLYGWLKQHRVHLVPMRGVKILRTTGEELVVCP